MSLDTYDNLKAEIAGWLHRSDLTDDIPTFIALCEKDLQKRCKLVDFETSATVTVTSGAGSLPYDYVGMRSVYWDYNPDKPLTYITPQRYTEKANESGIPEYYTIEGTTIRVAATNSGNLVIQYLAKFSELSASNPTNSLLADHPAAYLYGSLFHAGPFTRNPALIQMAKPIYEDEIALIKRNNAERKYGAALAVKAA